MFGHSGHFRSVSSVSQREIVTTNFWNFVHLHDAQARVLRPFIWNFTENCFFYRQNTVKLVGVGFSSTKLGPPWLLLTLLRMSKAFTIIVYHLCNVSTWSHVILNQTYLLYHSETNSSGGIQDKTEKDN